MTQMGCSAGSGKMCFMKKAFNSTTCHMHMKRETAIRRMYEGRVQPPCVGPRLRCELHQRPLELASDRRLVLHRLPLVLAHGEELAHLHPGEDAKPVADQHVEHQVVPPALV